MKQIVKTCVVGGLFLALSGCSMAPVYQQPQLPVASTLQDRYLETLPSSGITGHMESMSGAGWREVFTDPVLQQLIAMALQNNRDLRETALNVEAYQAQYRIQKSNQLPTVSSEGYGSKQRNLGGAGHTTSETYSLQVRVTAYELDFFGRVKNLKDQALEQYLAMEEARKSAEISLVAEVSRAYLTWLADRELLQITQDTERLEAESYALVKNRLDGGVATELDLAQARSSLEGVRANLAMYRRQVAQDYHYLNLLTGTSLSEHVLPEKGMLHDVKPLAVMPASLSSSVLLQRPDIIAAEHELKGANANIGAARAAFFPTISLTAGAGVVSTDLSDLFNGSSGSWLFAPTITVPIFTAGRLQAELDVAQIEKERYVVRYEQAIQTAFREVSDALVAVETYEKQLLAQKGNLDASEQYFQHARNRYEEGVDSFLTLLDAQRSLYSSRQAYLSLNLAQLENQVNLYKVLGGGWKETTE
ncbi:efflux transporter outer membrane subunit [Desulfopila aestuarii]|uniref:Outer membrane protein, multidrug efflux system n=1 Tax=Desulfopila aestuarii DSM 18488 TaxID=1121416 RepID=A0A1M7YBA7_9BACT|nr:efflux transporter outer membrane subunit [Desulfopila aestuarii]SHO49915.1 outer membrane protein, multidrug efflux system [Desulfopila aestuarii DSM 18488]